MKSYRPSEVINLKKKKKVFPPSIVQLLERINEDVGGYDSYFLFTNIDFFTIYLAWLLKIENIERQEEEDAACGLQGKIKSLNIFAWDRSVQSLKVEYFFVRFVGLCKLNTRKLN